MTGVMRTLALRVREDLSGLNHFRIVDETELRGLIESWELVNVEFKSRRFVQPLSVDHRKALAAALVSLANRGGGYLIIGVDDKTHKIEPGGFEGKDILAGQIANVGSDLCSPPTKLSHRYLPCREGEALILEVAKRGQIPHAVVKKGGARIYYIRNNQGKQLVTDTELQQMFQNADFPALKKSFSFVYFFERRSLLEPHFEDIPPWRPDDVVFRAMMPKIRRLGKEEPDRIPQMVAQVFPYAVISTIDWGLSAGWGRHIRPAGLGVTLEPSQEPSKTFTSGDIPRPPENSLFATVVSDFADVATLLVFFELVLPPDTVLTIEYPSPAASSLVLRAEGVYQIRIDYSGGHWSVGLPYGHPNALSIHPTRLKADEPFAWILGHVDMEFQMEFGEFGPRTQGDCYAWAKRLFELVESKLSWAKFLERLPDPYLLRIDRNVRRVLEQFGKDEESDSGTD